MSDVVTTQSSVGVVSEGDMAEGVASPIDESDTNAQVSVYNSIMYVFVCVQTHVYSIMYVLMCVCVWGGVHN